MNKTQADVFQIYEELSNLFERLHLKYFVVGGTAIGAIRHQGFIPWDDDFDIAMTRENFTRLQMYLREKENTYNNLFVMFPEQDSYYFSYAKVLSTRNSNKFTDKTNGINGSFIDVFPLDFVGKLGLRQKVLFSFYRVINHTILEKYSTAHFSAKWSLLAPLVRSLSLLGIDHLKSIRSYITKQMKSKKGDLYLNMGSPYPLGKECYHSEEIVNTVMKHFENRSVPVAAGYDSILRRTYGNYMLLPDQSERHSPHS